MDITEFKQKLTYEHHRTVDKNKAIYIFGAGNFAKDVGELLIKEGYNVLGFVVSYKKTQKLLDLPIYEWKEIVTRDAKIVMGVYSHNVSYTKILNEMTTNGFNDPIMPWELYNQFESHLGWRYWLTSKNFYNNNIENIDEAYNLYCDEESQNCLLNALLFRIGLNPEYANYRSQGQHYFNDLSLSRFKDKSIKLVDGGAFTGDTYKIANRLISMSLAFLFEPDPANYKQLQKTVGKNAICYPLGLSDSSKTIRFRSNVGPSSVVDDSGDLLISVVSLDTLWPSSTVDLIKLDIEGSEAAALNGATKLIERSRPVIVIAGYHRPGDLWDLVFLLRNICKDYKFYLRQHDYNSFESVIYAVPN